MVAFACFSFDSSLFISVLFRKKMSDYGEKTCPLCAEEMDLTDQQLKPCKCGYQVHTSFLIYIFFCDQDGKLGSVMLFIFYFEGCIVVYTYCGGLRDH